MLKGAGVSAARVVLCLLWAHPFLYVSLLPCPPFSSPPNPPFQTLACYGRAWAPRAFATGALSAPATGASCFSRTCACFRTDALSYARACFPTRVFSACARAFPRACCCVRACFPARVFAACARAFPRAFFLARACLRARVFPACARAFPRASSVCVRLFYHTACGRAHAECAPRFFVFSLNIADSYASLRTPATKLCVSTITS